MCYLVYSLKRLACPLGKHGCYHAVIFDVNTDDESSALTAPPPSFLDHKVLENVSALLHSSGKILCSLNVSFS